MNRRKALIIFGTAATGLAAAALGAKNYWEEFQSRRRSNLLIAGSAPMISYIQKIAAAFEKSNKNIDIVSEKGHSGGALLALNRGGIDLAVMDRNLTQEEFNLIDHNMLAGIDGIGIVVHPDSPVKSISIEQARHIFEGLIVNWKEVGGQDAPINMYGRKPNSTTRSSIEDILMAGGTLSRRIKEMKSATEVSKAVASDRDGVGYVSVRTMQDTTRALAINGVELNEKNLLINRYPLFRSMYLVLNREGTANARKFVSYTLSDAGQKILADTGMLRVR